MWQRSTGHSGPACWGSSTRTSPWRPTSTSGDPGTGDIQHKSNRSIHFLLHGKKKVRKFPVPSRYVTTKLCLGGNNDVITELFLPRGSLVSDIPAGEGNSWTFFYGVVFSVSGWNWELKTWHWVQMLASLQLLPEEPKRDALSASIIALIRLTPTISFS